MNELQLDHSGLIGGGRDGSSKNNDESGGTTAVLSRNQPTVGMENGVSTLEPAFKERRVLKVILHRLEDENVAELIKKAVAELALTSLRIRKKKPKPNKNKKKRRIPTKKSMPNLKRLKPLYFFKCNKCRSKFCSQERLSEHTLSNCDTERVFTCNTCDKNFIFKRHLTKHQTRNCHVLKTYTCKICQKSFRQNCKLTKHMSVHRKDSSNKKVGGLRQLFKCSKCRRRFKSQEGLADHTYSNCDTERVFDCDICGKNFIFKRHLVEHKTPICHSLRTYKCKTCDKTFKKNRSLKEHMLVHSEEGRPQMLCDICGMITKGGNYKLQEHLRLHSGEKPFSCKNCGKSFRTKHSLTRHLASYSEKKLLICAMCGKGFRIMSSLKNHMAVHGMVTLQNKHKCNICGKLFYKRSLLSSHMRTHFNANQHVCKICQAVFETSKDLTKHKNTLHLGEKQYVSETCEVKVAENGSLGLHIVSNSDKSLYPCTLCTKYFKTSGILKDHLRIHSGEKPYSCKICGKSFSRNRYLRKHIQLHSGKSYQCTVCSKSLKSSESLKEHLRIHSEEKPYSCKICGRGFSKNRYLIRHIQSLHSGKSYQCNVCSKSLISSESLEEHLRIHSGEKPYSCKICGRSFSKNQYLRRHIQLLHSGKSYQCTVCSKSLKSSASLKEHLRIHSGEKPYSCIICGKRFCTYSNFKRHMFTHSVNKPCFDYVKNHENIKADEKPVLCNVCGIACPTISDLEVHLTKMHSNNQENIKYICKVPNYHEYFSFLSVADKEKPFLCKICGILCSTSNDLDVHIEGHSSKSEDLNLLGNMNIVHKYTSSHLSIDYAKPLLCNICGICCTTVNDLEIHTQVHSNNLEDIDFLGKVDIVHKNNSLIPSTENEKPFLCNVCGKCCTNMNDLEIHTLTHSSKPEERNYQENVYLKFTSSISLTDNKVTQSITHKIHCETCMKTFGSRYSLKRHVLNVHNKSNLTNCVCKFCKKNFTRLDRLKNHIASQHNYEVPSADGLIADIKLESSSIDPVVSESDDKSHICKQCGQVFSCELSLSVHYNVCMLKLSSFEGCNKKSDQKTFCCAVCKTGFKTLDALSLHMIIHETLTTAPSSFLLNMNSYSHNNEDQFEQNILKCIHCGQKFTKMSDLKTHMQTHSVMPFTCGICQISFNKLDFLRQHINTEHQNITFSTDKNDDNDVAITLDRTQHQHSEKYQVIPYLEEDSKISEKSDSGKKTSVLDLDSVVQYLTGETSIDLEAGVEISFKNY